MNNEFHSFDLNKTTKSVFLNQNNSNRIVVLNTLFLIALLVTGNANPMAIVFAFVFETVIIGLIHIVKLICLIPYGDDQSRTQSKFLKVALIGFFLIHYGFFVFIQSTFLYLAFTLFDTRFSTSLSFDNLKVILQLEGFYFAMLSISLGHIVEFFFNFIKNKKYKDLNFIKYYPKPYLRIFIQQFVAIIPFFFLFFGNSVGFIAALMLILIRAFMDLYLNGISRKPARLDKITRYLSKEKPEEYEKVKEMLLVFFE